MASVAASEDGRCAPPPPPSPPTAVLFLRVTAPESIPLQLIITKLTKHHLLRLRLVNRALCQAVSQHVTIASCAPDSPPLRQPLTTLFPYLSTLILSHYPSPPRAARGGAPVGLAPFLEHTTAHLPDALRTVAHLRLSLHASCALIQGNAEPIHRLLIRCPALQSVKVSTPDFTVTLRAPPPLTPHPLTPPPTLHAHLAAIPPCAPLLDPASWSAHPTTYSLALHTTPSDTSATHLLLPALHTASLASLTLDTPLPLRWLTNTLLTTLTAPPLPLTALTHLHFSPAAVPDAPPDPLLAAVPHLPALRSLVLAPTPAVWTPWHEPAPPFIIPAAWSRLSLLTHLALYHAALPSLTHLPTLRHLTHSSPVGPPPLSQLFPLTALTHLDLRLHGGGARPSMWAIHTVLPDLPPAWCRGLRRLELACHSTAAALPQLTALTALHLSCFPMTPALVLALARLPHLAHLHLAEPIPRPDPPPAPAPPTPLAARPLLPALRTLRIALSSHWSWDPLHVLATTTRLPRRRPTIIATDRCTVTDPRRLPPAPLHHWSPCWLLAALSADGELSIPLLDPRDVDILDEATAQLPSLPPDDHPAARPVLAPARQQQLLLYAGASLSHADVQRALRLACGTFGRISLYCHGWGEAAAGDGATGSSTASLVNSARPQGTAALDPTASATPTPTTIAAAGCNPQGNTRDTCSAAAAAPGASAPRTITPCTAALAPPGPGPLPAAASRASPTLQQALQSLGLHSPVSPPGGLRPGTLAGLRRVHMDCRGLPCRGQLQALVAAAPQLEHLAATNAAHVCDRLLEQLHGSCPRLQNLWLSGLKGGVTLAGLLPLMATTRGLRGVTLHWCWDWVSALYPWVPETVYARLAAACPAAALAWHKVDSSTVELTLRRIMCEPCL